MDKSGTAEKWTVRPIRPGDIVRVYNGRFYHFGIYIGNETIVHFAGPDAETLTDPSLAVIRKDSLDHFAMGRPMEVREYSFRERFRKFPPGKIIENALRHVGEAGYDIIYNNCEHFVNKCAFGIAFSTQIEEMRKSVN